MRARTAGRAVVAYMWWLLKPAASVAFVVGIVGLCVSFFERSGWVWWSISGVAIVLLLVSLIQMVSFKGPAGRAGTALYLELSRLVDQWPDGQLLRSQDSSSPDGEVFLQCLNAPFRRGFLRIHATEVEPPQVAQAAWVPMDEFRAVPFTNTVVHLTSGAEVGEDGVITTPEGLSMADALKAAKFMTATGHDFASVQELRDLVRQVRSARPSEDLA